MQKACQEDLKSQNNLGIDFFSVYVFRLAAKQIFPGDGRGWNFPESDVAFVSQDAFTSAYHKEVPRFTTLPADIKMSFIEASCKEYPKYDMSLEGYCRAANREGKMDDAPDALRIPIGLLGPGTVERCVLKICQEIVECLEETAEVLLTYQAHEYNFERLDEHTVHANHHEGVNENMEPVVIQRRRFDKENGGETGLVRFKDGKYGFDEKEIVTGKRMWRHLKRGADPNYFRNWSITVACIRKDDLEGGKLLQAVYEAVDCNHPLLQTHPRHSNEQRQEKRKLTGASEPVDRLWSQYHYSPPRILTRFQKRLPRFNHSSDISDLMSYDIKRQTDYTFGILPTCVIILSIATLWFITLIVLKRNGECVGCASGRPFVAIKRERSKQVADRFGRDMYVNPVRQMLSVVRPRGEILPPRTRMQGLAKPPGSTTKKAAKQRKDPETPVLEREETVPHKRRKLLWVDLNKKKRQADQLRHETEQLENQRQLHTVTLNRSLELITRLTFLACGLGALLSTYLLLSKGVAPIKHGITVMNEGLLEASGILRESKNITNDVLQVSRQIKSQLNHWDGASEGRTCPLKNPNISMAKKVASVQLAEVDSVVAGFVHRMDVQLKKFQTNADEFTVTLNRVDEWLWVPSIYVFAINAVVASLMAGTMRVLSGHASLLNRSMTWGFLPLLIFLVVLSWALTCVVLVLAALNADACVSATSPGNPETIILGILSEQGADKEASLDLFTKTFLERCTKSSLADPFEQYQETVTSALYTLNSVQVNIDEVAKEKYFCDANNTRKELRAFQLGLNMIDEAMNRLEYIYRCEKIIPLYQSLFHESACMYSVSGLIWTHYLLLAISIFGTMMIMLRTSWLEAEINEQNKATEVAEDTGMNDKRKSGDFSVCPKETLDSINDIDGTPENSTSYIHNSEVRDVNLDVRPVMQYDVFWSDVHSQSSTEKTYNHGIEVVPFGNGQKPDEELSRWCEEVDKFDHENGSSRHVVTKTRSKASSPADERESGSGSAACNVSDVNETLLDEHETRIEYSGEENSEGECDCKRLNVDFSPVPKNGSSESAESDDTRETTRTYGVKQSGQHETYLRNQTLSIESTQGGIVDGKEEFHKFENTHVPTSITEKGLDKMNGGDRDTEARSSSFQNDDGPRIGREPIPGNSSSRTQDELADKMLASQEQYDLDAESCTRQKTSYSLCHDKKQGSSAFCYPDGNTVASGDGSLAKMDMMDEKNTNPQEQSFLSQFELRIRGLTDVLEKQENEISRLKQQLVLVEENQRQGKKLAERQQEEIKNLRERLVAVSTGRIRIVEDDKKEMANGVKPLPFDAVYSSRRWEGGTSQKRYKHQEGRESQSGDHRANEQEVEPIEENCPPSFFTIENIRKGFSSLCPSCIHPIRFAISNCCD